MPRKGSSRIRSSPSDWKSVAPTAFILMWVLWTAGMLSADISLAHPGRTDSRGGHTCRKNCSSWGLRTGQYHFHGRPESGGTVKRRSPSPPLFRSRAKPKDGGSTGGVIGRRVGVSGAIDGDTFVGELWGRSTVFRLECVEAPELEQELGTDARDRLKRFLEEAGAKIEILSCEHADGSACADRKSDDNQAGALVVRVADAKGRDPAEILASDGLLWTTCDRYESIMEQAKARGVGIWGRENPVAPWDFRLRSQESN